jgi:hypothetical protein
MNVSQLRSTFPGFEWRQGFAEALLKLAPHLNPDAVDEISDAEFKRVPQLAAPCAASAYAVEHGFGSYLEARTADDEVSRTWVPASDASGA